MPFSGLKILTNKLIKNNNKILPINYYNKFSNVIFFRFFFDKKKNKIIKELNFNIFTKKFFKRFFIIFIIKRSFFFFFIIWIKLKFYMI